MKLLSARNSPVKTFVSRGDSVVRELPLSQVKSAKANGCGADAAARRQRMSIPVLRTGGVPAVAHSLARCDIHAGCNAGGGKECNPQCAARWNGDPFAFSRRRTEARSLHEAGA